MKEEIPCRKVTVLDIKVNDKIKITDCPYCLGVVSIQDELPSVGTTICVHCAGEGKIFERI